MSLGDSDQPQLEARRSEVLEEPESDRRGARIDLEDVPGYPGFDMRSRPRIDLRQDTMDERVAQLRQQRIETRSPIAQTRIPASVSTAVRENVTDQRQVLRRRARDHCTPPYAG